MVGQGNTIAEYDYTDADENLLYQVVRLSSKKFRQRRPDGNGGWIWNLKDVERVLYNLPTLLAAITKKPGNPVFLVEGERDVDSLRGLDIVATTNPGGAGKWNDSYNEVLGRAPVVIIPDNDGPGHRHAKEVAAQLPNAILLELPGLPPKGDVTDWLKAGGTREELLYLARKAMGQRDPPDLPDNPPCPQLESVAQDIGPRPAETARLWPEPLREQAYHGIVGDVVRAIGPHSEADPVALLVSFLIAFGNAAGLNSYFVAEADRHFPRLFVSLVGETSKGRKGSSWGHVKRIIKSVDPTWEACLASGMSSGEGLIWSVRNEITKREPIRKKGIVESYQDVVVDPGIEDKRLLVVEAEFASTLRVLGREGNTLSAIIRAAWDTGDLRSLTKNSPATATGAHISILGHITRHELLRYLDRTEAGNGFANRFMWFCVRRSKCLPEGGNIAEVDFAPVVKRIGAALECAGRPREMRRSESAKTIWAEIYPDLSEGLPGMLGAVTGRAEAQVMRLATIYALSDCSDEIEVQHLLAALAVWDYSFASARYIFGKALGDQVADGILKALETRPEGMTRTDISTLFNRNKSSREINQALKVLRAAGKVRSVTEETGGAPSERVFMCES